MGNLILAHDLGTSGNKATLYNFNGELVASNTHTYDTLTPANGFVEQDPQEWWRAVCESTKKMIQDALIRPSQIDCVTFSGQMMGCIPVDKDGNHLYHALIWADTRYNNEMYKIEKNISLEETYRITGHRLSASYSAAKFKWIQDNRPDIYKKTFKMLNAKDYVIGRMTGVYGTDYSDASGTNLLDIREKTWSDRMLDAFQIDKNKLPEIYKSTDIVGKLNSRAAAETGLLEGTPVVMGGGDGSCAAVGAGVVSEGNVYNVLGSSSWISCAKSTPVFDESMRTFNWIALNENLFTPCGTMQSAGYSFKWASENLFKQEKELIKKTDKSFNLYLNELVETTLPGANNLLFLPYLLGERSPRWNLNARGAFVGLGASHTNTQMLRSVMEGVGFNLKLILEALENGTHTEEVILIGGGAKSITWLQILADIWQKKIVVPKYLEEATSMGAAICAGVGLGEFSDFSVISRFNPKERVIEPNSENKEIYDKLYRIFNEAYDSLEAIYNKLNLT